MPLDDRLARVLGSWREVPESGANAADVVGGLGRNELARTSEE